MLETGPGASSFLRPADGAQRRNDYSLHYKWLKQSLGPAEATALGDPVRIGLEILTTDHFCPISALFISENVQHMKNIFQSWSLCPCFSFTIQRFKILCDLICFLLSAFPPCG